MTLSETAANMEAAATAAAEAGRRRFVEAAWAGAEPAALLELAKAAGLSVGTADALLAEIRTAQADALEAEKLPDAAQALRDADGRYQGIRERQEAVIAEAERLIDAAAQTAATARAAVEAAQAAAERVVKAKAAGNVPDAVKLPTACRAIEKRRAAELEQLELHKRWTAAKARTADVRRALEAMRADVGKWAAEQPNVSRLVGSGAVTLADARKRLAQAEAALKQAEADERDAERAHRRAAGPSGR